MRITHPYQKQRRTTIPHHVFRRRIAQQGAPQIVASIVTPINVTVDLATYRTIPVRALSKGITLWPERHGRNAKYQAKRFLNGSSCLPRIPEEILVRKFTKRKSTKEQEERLKNLAEVAIRLARKAVQRE